MKRRIFIQLVGSVAAANVLPTFAGEESEMYGLISQMVATEGKRDELIEILLGSVSGMPGCLSYVVSKDASDPNALWITEVWESKEKHQASLSLPAVQAAMGQGRPLIAGMGSRAETIPVGGHGI